MANNQSHPNEIKYFNVKADGVDITSMVLQLDIFQELFMPTWSCQMAFSDTQNLLMNIPIKAGTTMSIIMETDYPTNESKNFTFTVYKISDRMQIKQEHQGYVISCVSKEFFTNQKKRVSKAYKAMSANAIASSILDEYGVGTMDDMDSDPLKYTLIVPNMSPFGAIAWVSRFAKNPSGGADFWFFQSDTGKFKYKSLDNMLADRSGVKFKQVNPNKYDDDSNTPDQNFLNIEHYEFVTQHDAMNNFAGGYYGNTVVAHNIYDKKIETSTFEYGDDISADKVNKPFDDITFKGSEKSHIVYHPVSTNGQGGAQMPADTYQEWLGSRKTNIMKLEDNRLVMAVPGAVSHFKLLGKQVDVELPSHQDIDPDEYLDKYMKGSYVVTAIRHTVDAKYYKCTLELGKKRLETAYE